MKQEMGKEIQMQSRKAGKNAKEIQRYNATCLF